LRGEAWSSQVGAGRMQMVEVSVLLAGLGSFSVPVTVAVLVTDPVVVAGRGWLWRRLVGSRWSIPRS
jgi:hypothetical protein